VYNEQVLPVPGCSGGGSSGLECSLQEFLDVVVGVRLDAGTSPGTAACRPGTVSLLLALAASSGPTAAAEAAVKGLMAAVLAPAQGMDWSC